MCCVFEQTYRKKKLEEKDIMMGKIRDICKSGNVVHISLTALDTDGHETDVEIKADDYDKSEISIGTIIWTNE